MSTKRVAWTGGSAPRPIAETPTPELFMAGLFFVADCASYERAWGTPPATATARIFWHRARHDAHAICR